MPSNGTYVCVPCRKVIKRDSWLMASVPHPRYGYISTYYGICPSCKGRMEYMGKHWRAPKKNNNRAWARIKSGDTLWQHRALRKKPGKGSRWMTYRSNHSPDMGG